MSPEEENRLFLERQRAGEVCDGVAFTRAGDVDPTPRTPPCDVPTEIPEEIFLPPSTPPDAEDPLRDLPAPIVVVGGAFSAGCPIGKNPVAGATVPVVYAKGALPSATQLVYLDSIAVIPSGELYRIAPLVGLLTALTDETLADAVLDFGYDWAVFDASIRSLIGVTEEVATAIREALVAAQLTANSIVEVVVASELRCEWPSRRLTAYCDPDADAGYSVAVYPTAVPGTPSDTSEVMVGVAASEVSQLDADAKAARIAARSLGCIFGNTTQTATCADIDDVAFAPGVTLPWVASDVDDAALRTVTNPLLYSLDTLEFSEVDALPGTRRLTLSATVSAGTVTGGSQDEANALAQALALAELDCFFPSRQRLFSCVDEGYGNAVARAMLGDETEARILNQMASGDLDGAYTPNIGVLGLPADGAIDPSVGVRTILPAGMFAGSSADEANDLAEVFAIATLECVWGNREMVYACDDKDSDPAEPLEVAAHYTENYPVDAGEPDVLNRANKEGQRIFSPTLAVFVDLLASPSKSSPYSDIVLARQFTSDAGQADADEIAATFAVSRLGCVYCNPRIKPFCVTLDAPLTVDTVPLPVAEEDLDGPQSVDATSGVPGVPYVADEFDVLQAPVDFLTNDSADTSFACGSAPEVMAIADAVGSIPRATLITGGGGGPDCQFFNVEQTRSCVTKFAATAFALTPASAALTITVPAGTFSGTGLTSAEAQANADAAALAFADTILVCEFGNPTLDVYCNHAPPRPVVATDYATPPTPTVFTLGSASADPDPDAMAPAAVGGATPVRAVKHSVTSQDSPDDATLQAYLLAVAQLDCFWENDSLTAYCPDVAETVGYLSADYCSTMDGYLAGLQAAATGDEALRIGALRDELDDICDGEDCGNAGVARAAREVTNYTTLQAAYAPGSPEYTFLGTRITNATTRASSAAGNDNCVFEVGTIGTVDGHIMHPSSVYEYGVVRGLFTSTESKAAATAMAVAMAESQLNCMYTHRLVIGVDECADDEYLAKLGFVHAGSIIAGSSSQATRIAKDLATSMNVCRRNAEETVVDTSNPTTNPFGVSGDPGDCCKIDMTAVVRAAAETKLHSPNGDGTYDVLTPDFSEMNALCASGLIYIYLEAYLHAREEGIPADRFYSTSAEITVSGGELPPFDKPGDEYTKVRRLVAQVFGSAADCSDLTILQSVTTAQKITAFQSGSALIPVITDLDSPSGDDAELGALGVGRSRSAEGASIDVNAGSVWDSGTETVVDALTNQEVTDGQFVVVKISRDAARVVTAAVTSVETTVPVSDEISQYVRIAKVSVDGAAVTKIEQLRYGDIVVFEALTLVNGQFRFVSLSAVSENSYDLAPAAE